MLSAQKALFKKGKLTLKEYPEHFVLIYKIKNTIKIIKTIPKKDKDQIYFFLLDWYFEYEWDGVPLPTKHIATLLGLSVPTTWRLLTRAQKRMRALW